MCGRSAALMLCVLSLFCVAGEAQAHRLNAEYRVLPGKKVRIESWFDSSGDSPKGATVQVFRSNGQLQTEGELDEKGIFTFTSDDTGPLRVVVSAGQGHRKELTIPPAELAAGSSVTNHARENDEPFADRSSQISLRDVLIGVGFLLAVAGLALGIRNAKEIRRVRRVGEPHCRD